MAHSANADNVEPPSEVPLRLSEAAASILDVFSTSGEEGGLDFATSREEMSEIWIERWSRRPIGPALGGSDGANDGIGHARVKILESYKQQPVAFVVEIRAVTFRVLHDHAVQERVMVEHLASAVVDEHGRHLAHDLRRKEAGAGLIPQIPMPCWCYTLMSPPT